MKAGHTISSLPLALCMFVVLAVIGPSAGGAFYQPDKEGTKTPPPAAAKEAKTAPTQESTRGKGRTASTSRGGKASSSSSDDADEDAGPSPTGKTGAAASADSQPRDTSPAQNNPRTTPSQNPAATAADAPRPEEGWLDSILYWALWALAAAGVLLLLTLLGYAVKSLIDNSRARTEGHFAALKKRQEELARRNGETLTALNTTVNNRMAELQAEVRELRRSIQDDNRAILDGVRRAGASSAYVASSAGYAPTASRFEKEEPAFPVPAEEYLNKSRRGALVVKPDFQNGILVQDAEGNGEFMLVRDNASPDELFYVIPRTGYFQTKQDFYNYYDRYYDCPRPSSGPVWIIQPAVVDRVNGGWQLREKGELEVR